MLGPVFRAYQPAPGRLVAVKQFRLGLSPDESQRFAAALDRIVAADLAQPGIAAPIAAGLADASPYLALDFVAAESFDVAMRESGPAQPREVVSFARQLAAALDAGAAAGVVHGALHPRDVLMAHDDVRITGLGVAQALESVGMAAPIRRPYAAPERMAGAPWDRRADIYSLAALAYEMLTGRRVLATGSESAEGLPPVEGADLDRLRVVFAKALAEKAGNRFETAGEFADALERALTPVARSKSNGRRRRSPDTPPPDLALPLDIALDTPPLGDMSGPHVEISAIDAAMPSSAGDNATSADLALHQPRPTAPDFANLDTRLDEFEGATVPELELHAIELAQAEAPSNRSPHGEHVLELGALDAAADRMAAARDALADGRTVDPEAIALTVPPLRADGDAGSPLDAIEQALGTEVASSESGQRTHSRGRGLDDVVSPESASGVNAAALDAALDLQSSEAAADRGLSDLALQRQPSSVSFDQIDETLARTSDSGQAGAPDGDAPVVADDRLAADAPAHVELRTERTEEPTIDEDAPELTLPAQGPPPALASSDEAPAVYVAADAASHDDAADMADEDDGRAPWDTEGVRAPREQDTLWHEESPGFAVDAALDALTARSAATPESEEIDVPLVSTQEDSDKPQDESEPVPVFARSMSLGQESAGASGGRPILLGVVLGLLVGFAFGYGVGQWRSGPTTGATETASQGTAETSTPRESARVAEPAAAPPNGSQAASSGAASQPAPSGNASPAASAPAPTQSPAPVVLPASPRTEARGNAAAPVPSPRTPAGRSEPANAASARETEAGRLVVRSTPSGASVTIDGKDAGLTPLTTTLRPGFHSVRLAHQGYVTTQRRVRITSQPAQPIDLELVARPAREVAATPAAPERASGSLVLDSRPTGARVYVDGALIGTTPMQIDAITGGDHAVRFEMDGFGPWSTTAKVTAGGKTRVSGSLER